MKKIIEIKSSERSPLLDVVDKLFCINLESRTDKLKNATEEFERVGMHGVELFAAIDGKKLGLKSTEPRITPGMIGCFRSHVEILNSVIERGLNSYCVFEDDIKLVDGFNEFLTIALPLLPEDWEFVYLGCTEYSGFGTYKKMVNDFWVIPSSAWGTQCFMVKGKNALLKLQAYLKKQQMQIDEQISNIFLPSSGVKCYSIFPSIVAQNFEMGSDVQQNKDGITYGLP